MSNDFVVRDLDSGREKVEGSKAEAEETKREMEHLGMNVEVVEPNAETATDGGPDETVNAEVVQDAPEPEIEPAERELAERTVSDDPLQWMPTDFVDTIDGTQAINRKGFEVLGHFYDVDVHSDLEVAPEDTGHEYCRVKATATTADGRVCEAYGSAHVDRGDDAHLLLEMSDTRARKRCLSIATGVGAVAVEELRSEANHE